MIKKLIFVIFLLACIPVGIFAYYNAHRIDINYIFGTAQLPLSWVLIASFASGALIMLPFFAFTGYIWKKKAISYQKQLNRIHKDYEKTEISNNFTN